MSNSLRVKLNLANTVRRTENCEFSSGSPSVNSRPLARGWRILPKGSSQCLCSGALAARLSFPVRKKGTYADKMRVRALPCEH